LSSLSNDSQITNALTGTGWYPKVGRAVVTTSGSRTVGFKSDGIVHRILKALLAAQVALCRFN
jgi:hypothetical protein